MSGFSHSCIFIFLDTLCSHLDLFCHLAASEVQSEPQRLPPSNTILFSTKNLCIQYGNDDSGESFLYVLVTPRSPTTPLIGKVPKDTLCSCLVGLSVGARYYFLHKTVPDIPTSDPCLPTDSVHVRPTPSSLRGLNNLGNLRLYNKDEGQKALMDARVVFFWTPAMFDAWN